jgi:hypothetical protein
MLEDTWGIQWYEAWQWQLLEVQLCDLALLLPKLQNIYISKYETQFNVARLNKTMRNDKLYIWQRSNTIHFQFIVLKSQKLRSNGIKE